MTHYKINPGTLQGEVFVPPSKSHTLRAILFGAIASGTTTITNYLPSPDVKAMIEACTLLGAHVKQTNHMLTVRGLAGRIQGAEDVISCGNSGIVLRFVSAIAGWSPLPIILTGDHSIRHNRPMAPLLEALRQLGGSAVSARGDDYAPVIIQGPLKPGLARLDGQDSQPVSALLIAALGVPGDVEILVDNPGEKPWIDLTLSWLQRFGVQVQNDNYQHYKLRGARQLQAFDYHVPGDWSSAAFPIAAALVTGSDITVKNVDFHDTQGDKKLLDILLRMGADLKINEEKHEVHVSSRGQLRGIEVDINDCIDCITILSVVACFAAGETRIRNAAIARSKECDRIHAIATELKKMGACIEEEEDGLRIQGSTLKGGAALSTYHDHRMVMSLSVASLGANGPSVVQNVECVAKTYPDFASDFQKLGAKLEVAV